MRKTAVLALVAFFALAAELFAIGEARVTGKVVDVNDKPIAGATIAVIATKERTFKQEYTSDKNGGFQAFLIYGSVPYKFVVSKEGYGTYEQVIKLKLVPEKNDHVFKLGSAGSTATTEVSTVEVKADPATEAYNEGVALANQKDDAGAVAKFEQAVAVNPELVAGYEALAKVTYRMKNYDKAIANANKVLAISPDEPDMFSILADAYEKTGDKAKAAEFKTRAPANPTSLFNDAAKLINAGKDAQAEPLLRQAIAAKEDFSIAYYELGMVYARMGKNADARANLQKYLELDPQGKEAPTAKEMLNYVK